MGKTEEGPNLAVTAFPPPRPESPNQGGKGRRSRETARVRGGVGGAQPAPPGAAETRLCGHQGAPGLLRLAVWPWLPALHQIPLANLIRCLGPDAQLWIPAPLRPQS